MKEKAAAMVLASFAADALALGAHWIYDTEKISQEFGTIRDLLPPRPGGYHATGQKGDFTHYGDQSFQLLKHLAEHRGQFDLADYREDWQRLFSNYHGYLDQATKTTLKNLANGNLSASCGSPSTDLGGAARIAPLIFCYRNDLESLLHVVEDQTTLTHTGSGVIDGARFIAGSCYSILHGATPYEAFTSALAGGIDDADLAHRLGKSISLKNRSVSQAVKEFGQMCAIQAALPGAVYTVLHYPDNLEEALIETVMAGGDSAARGMVVGMILGGSLGESAIPEKWLKGMGRYHEIIGILDKLS